MRKCLPLALPANWLGLALLLANLFFLTPSASAYDLARGCTACHGFPAGGGAHARHAFTCATCHVSGIGDNPDTAICATCHANPGLVDRHVNRGEACLTCHAPDPLNVDDDGDSITENGGDCNDADPSIFPGAVEVCGDGIDQDCSGADTICAPVDNDNDGSTAGLDCNDANPSIFPGAVEICDNGVDENCYPNDDICAPTEDADNDGYSVAQGDCNDTDDTLHPGAVETCGNGIDENCNPNDDVCADVDGDGFSVADGDCNDMNASIHPDAGEIVGNGIDENCSGMADDREPATEECTDWRFQVKRAVYNQAKYELSIRGTIGDSTEIVVSAGDNGAILASARVEAPSWKVKIPNLSDTPETVLVETEAGCLDEVEVRVRKRKAVRDEDRDDAEQPEAPSVPHVFGWNNPKEQHRDAVEDAGVSQCLGCHSIDQADKGQAMSCYRCHGPKWKVEDDAEDDDQPGGEPPTSHTFGWTDPAEQHRDQVEALGVEACTVCHSTQEADQGQPLSCFNCHDNEWTDSENDEEPAPDEEPTPVEEPAGHPFGWDNPGKSHDDYVERNGVGQCLGCHSTQRDDRGTPLSCYKCHGREW